MGNKKNGGHIFEAEFKNSVPPYMYVKKLKVSGMNYKGGGNEGDFLLYQYPNLFIFELKSHKGISIPFDVIRESQLKGLYDLNVLDGVICGFVFNFRDLEETYFIDISKVIDFIDKGERKSFPISWVKDNGILIDQKKKRVRFNYDIKKLVDQLKEVEE